jgi:nitrate/TMAO reductase-like tetraheme cytochrome c subunit
MDRRLLVLAIGLILAITTLAVITASSAEAAPSSQEVSNDTCLSCHGEPGLSKILPSGETWSLFIDASHFSEAVHGQEEVACVACHERNAAFPHPEFVVADLRDVSLQLYQTCQKCHEEQYSSVLDSVHQRAFAAGNFEAAVCTDCHNPHEQKRITDKTTGEILPEARLRIPETCARCHSTIYENYKETVHGAALTVEGNTDVPTCIDCHGVHNIQDPTTAEFRNDTPLLCARCHTDPAIMDKYGLSTDVYDTYVTDFHGTTVALFEKVHPDWPTNKAVCTDCHGIHDIKPVDDTETGIALKENLLVKCQRCHPDATTNFPDSWMSHYIASPVKHPLVYYVNLFYKIFIPAVLGGMAVYVLTDVYRRFIARRKGATHS